jgi:hypothetical protein
MTRSDLPARPRKTQVGPYRVPDASQIPSSLLGSRGRTKGGDLTKRYKAHLRSVALPRPTELGSRPDPSTEVLRGPEQSRGLRPLLPVRESRGLFRPERDGSRPVPGEADDEDDEDD